MTGKSSARIAVLGTVASSALLLAVAAPPALAVDKPTEPGELTLIDSAQGKVLADKDGNPLHLRDADKPDTPDCTGECAANRPAAIGYRAARGGAHHTLPTAAAERHPEAGPLALGSAAVAAGAGVIGFALLRRRRAEQRADDTKDGPS